MSRALAAALALAAAVGLALPAGASAGRALTPECPVMLCAGVSTDGSRVVFPFSEELTEGMDRPQVYGWAGGRVRPLAPIPAGAPKSVLGIRAVSSDARHVFIETGLSLAADDVDGGVGDIYDIGGATATLISTGPLDAGRGGASFTSFAGASADGSRAFFNSISGPMLAGESGSCWYPYERAGGVTSPVVYGPLAQEPLPPHLCYGDSFDGVSADGSHTFFSTERRLIEADEGGEDIYQRVGGVLSVVTSYPEPGPEQPGGGGCVDLPRFADTSADGGTVLFATNTAISPEDTDSAFDVYERRPDGSFPLISRGTAGGTGCGFAGDRAIALSADGSIAIFETRAQLGAADHDASNDVYRAQDGAAPLLLSTGPADPGGDEHSPVFPDWITAVSDDARTVALETKAPLVAEDRDHSMDVYVNVDGTTALVSTGPVKAGGGSAAELRGLAGDGSVVVFSTKGRLVSTDLDQDPDIYLRRVAAGKTKLLSAEAIAPRMRLARRGRLRASGAAMVRVTCPKAETSGPCRGAVTLSRGKRRLGRAKFSVEPGKRRWITVPVAGTLGPKRSIRVLARVRAEDRLGNTSVATRGLRLLGRPTRR